MSELASVGQLPLAGQNDNGTSSVNPRKRPLAPPLHPPGALYPRCTVDPLPEEVASRITLGSRGLKQTFERPISDPQFRAPYAHAPPPQSFAGGIGSRGVGFGAAPMEPSAFAPPPPSDTWYPPEDPFATFGGTPGRSELDEMMNLIDSDTIAMWTNAPTGFE